MKTEREFSLKYISILLSSINTYRKGAYDSVLSNFYSTKFN